MVVRCCQEQRIMSERYREAETRHKKGFRLLWKSINIEHSSMHPTESIYRYPTIIRNPLIHSAKQTYLQSIILNIEEVPIYF